MVKKVSNQLVGLIEGVVWVGFVLASIVAIWPDQAGSFLTAEPYLTITGMTRVIWPYVTLLTGVVLRFSRRYMAGNHRLGYFFFRCLGFLLSVMWLSATDHMVIFAGCWAVMGWFISGLISHKIDWSRARAAGRLALMYFLSGSLFLFIALSVLYINLQSLKISDVLQRVDQLPAGLMYTTFLLLVIAVIIQSGLFPTQDWLMSSMTAPTPASALMHAGFVNAGGILLTTFAPLFANRLLPMSILVGLGAVSALMGNIWKLVHSAVKRQLGCSTVAQMGFMILQCGLGFFSAAITHLILHGFYKGFLFLNCGNAIEQTSTSAAKKSEWSSPLVILEAALTALASGVIFVVLTGKGTKVDSGLFLTFIVVLAILHGSQEFVDQKRHTSSLSRLLFPSIALLSTAVYSGIFVGISHILPKVATTPTPFTWFHGVLIAVFLGAYLVKKSDLHETFPRLYVYILNASQPHHDTIISSREDYNV